MFQSTIWPIFKKHIPGFVQGYTKDELMNLLRHYVTEAMVSISGDGKSFDSAQHKKLMAAVDDKFIELLRPLLKVY